jgi:DtxR family Mn-dependent transcriptional regulator
MHGTAVQDYLKAIYQLGEREARVAPSAVAETLRVTQAAVTKMVRRLGELELVTYVRADGIRLTAEGRRVALETLRHHRLLETFLAEKLGYSWDEVHEEAEKLEHVISEAFERKIDRALGHPTHDPHGDPIPTADGRIPEERHPSLADTAPGTTVRVERVDDGDPERLRYLGELGLYPETVIRVLEPDPFGGPLHVEIAGERRPLGLELARAVFVSIRPEGSR